MLFRSLFLTTTLIGSLDVVYAGKITIVADLDKREPGIMRLSPIEYSTVGFHELEFEGIFFNHFSVKKSCDSREVISADEADRIATDRAKKYTFSLDEKMTYFKKYYDRYKKPGVTAAEAEKATEEALKHDLFFYKALDLVKKEHIIIHDPSKHIATYYNPTNHALRIEGLTHSVLEKMKVTPELLWEAKQKRPMEESPEHLTFFLKVSYPTWIPGTLDHTEYQHHFVIKVPRSPEDHTIKASLELIEKRLWEPVKPRPFEIVYSTFLPAPLKECTESKFSTSEVVTLPLKKDVPFAFGFNGFSFNIRENLF